MKRLLVWLMMVPMVAVGTASLARGSASGNETSIGGIPPVPTTREWTTVRIDTMVWKVSYLFEPQQALVLPADSSEDNFCFLCAYNVGTQYLRSRVFWEEMFEDPGSWISADLFTCPGEGSLRYISPSASFDGAFWYPEVTFNVSPPMTTWILIDEGGVGSNIWSLPYEIPTQYECDLPITWSGPNLVVYMLAKNTSLGGYLFVAIGGFGGSIINEQTVLPSVHGLGYENSQLMYHEGTNKIVVAVGGYRSGDFGDPDNPLLVVFQESTDGGETWSEEIWLDRETVPDMPGSVPGIEAHYSNSFFDMIVDDDGDLHFAAVLVDSGCYGNESEVFGVYDVHQNDGIWTASLISDGVYGEFDPGAQYLGGDSWAHSPSLSLTPDGRLVACWNDIGWDDPDDSLFSVDIYVSGSTDDGNSWSEPNLITETPDSNEYFSRLTQYTTNENAYIVTMYGGDSSSVATSDESPDGPMDCIQLTLGSVFGVPADDLPVPETAMLDVIGANPFGDKVSLFLTLTKPAEVRANVYNIKGELVEVLLSGLMQAGEHELVFDPRKHAPGVYFCRVQTENETMLNKLVFIR